MNYRDKAATARRRAPQNTKTDKSTNLLENNNLLKPAPRTYAKTFGRVRSASQSNEEYYTARNLLKFIQTEPAAYQKLIDKQGVFDLAKNIQRDRSLALPQPTQKDAVIAKAILIALEQAINGHSA